MKYQFQNSCKLVILLFCLALVGCASYNDYISSYQKAIKASSSTVVTKEGDYEELKSKITGYFQARGYSSVIYSDEKKGFYVYNKEGMFQEPCQIILKYTIKPNDPKIRIDLVREGDSIITESQVTEDINQIADQIKNN